MYNDKKKKIKLIYTFQKTCQHISALSVPKTVYTQEFIDTLLQLQKCHLVFCGLWKDTGFWKTEIMLLLKYNIDAFISQQSIIIHCKHVIVIFYINFSKHI